MSRLLDRLRAARRDDPDWSQRGFWIFAAIPIKEFLAALLVGGVLLGVGSEVVTLAREDVKEKAPPPAAWQDRRYIGPRSPVTEGACRDKVSKEFNLEWTPQGWRSKGEDPELVEPVRASYASDREYRSALAVWRGRISVPELATKAWAECEEDLARQAKRGGGSGSGSDLGPPKPPQSPELDLSGSFSLTVKGDVPKGCEAYTKYVTTLSVYISFPTYDVPERRGKIFLGGLTFDGTLRRGLTFSRDFAKDPPANPDLPGSAFDISGQFIEVTDGIAVVGTLGVSGCGCAIDFVGAKPRAR